jgi:hypothetical protein
MRALLKFAALQARRAPMHLLIRDLANWEPLAEPMEGYTVVIACMKALAPVAVANLQLCVRQECPGLRELILVFDCPPEEIPREVLGAVEEASRSIDVRLLGYDRRSHRVARRINWGWVYSWLSWCKGIAEARTRAVLIHDMDAMPIHPGLFEHLHRNWEEERAEFCGIRTYRGNGVTEDMGLVTTFELVLDAAHVRSRFRPFDLFNKPAVVDGRAVDFDTMLHAQWRSPRRAVREIDESHLVHPSQLICHYTDLVAGRADFRGRGNSLPMLPYFYDLGGDPSLMDSVGPQIADAAGDGAIHFLGRPLYVDGIPPSMWAWFEKLIRRAEQALHQRTRPEVESYLRGFIRRAGDQRTVGREVGANAVAEI